RDRFEDWRYERLAEQVRTLVPVRIADEVIGALAPDQVIRLDRFLGSADFEQFAMHLLLRAARPNFHQGEQIPAHLPAGLRESLRHSVGAGADALTVLTDTIFDSLTVACAGAFGLLDQAERATVIGWAPAQAHLAALATRNVRLLERVADLAAVHEAAE